MSFLFMYYTSVIVQSYTGKTHKLIAICMPSVTTQTSDISGITGNYGENDFIMQTFDFIAHTTCNLIQLMRLVVLIQKWILA